MKVVSCCVFCTDPEERIFVCFYKCSLFSFCGDSRLKLGVCDCELVEHFLYI